MKDLNSENIVTYHHRISDVTVFTVDGKSYSFELQSNPKVEPPRQRGNIWLHGYIDSPWEGQDYQTCRYIYPSWRVDCYIPSTIEFTDLKGDFVTIPTQNICSVTKCVRYTSVVFFKKNILSLPAPKGKVSLIDRIFPKMPTMVSVDSYEYLRTEAVKS